MHLQPTGRTIIALAIVFAAFAPTLGFGFVNWDDDLHVYRNAAVVGEVSWRERLLTPRLGYPIPVTVATYAVEHALFGLTPQVMHATNLLLHLASCLMVFGIGRRLGLGLGGALAALLLFGLHPVVAEPVSWISGRKDLLATTLALAATMLFLEGTAQESARRRRPLLAMTLLTFVLAALSKPTVLCLPLAWAFMHARLGRQTWRTAWATVVPALAISGLVLALAFVGQQQVGAVGTSFEPAVWLRQLWYAFGYHLGLVLLLRLPLAKHIPPAMPPPFDPLVDLLPLAVGLVLIVVARRWPPRRVAVPIGLVWAGLGYLPNANVVPLVRFLADSYVYLPLAGLAWAAGAAGEALWAAHGARMRRGLALAAGAAATACLVMSALAASAPWQSGLALWLRVHGRYQDSPQVCRNLGNAYHEAHRPAEALEQYQACARRFGSALFDKNIAITLFKLGRREEAAALFERLARARPGDPVVEKYLRLVRSSP